jgi:hypothetical protein
MNVRRFLVSTAMAAALVLPAMAAHAQTVTVTSKPTGTNSAYGTTRNTPGATAVGGYLFAIATADGSGLPNAPGISDASHNNWTLDAGPVIADDGFSHAWIWSAPVTTASSAAETVTMTGVTAGSPNYPTLVVIYVAPVAGYTLGGIDCHNHGQLDGAGVLTDTCTTTQANDVLIGGGGYNITTAASGTNLLQGDTANSGAFSGYAQPSTSGAQSLNFNMSAADNEMVMDALKVTPNGPQPLSVSVTPSSYNPSACPVTSGTTVATASSSGGDGNPVTYSLGGASVDPSLAINSSSGAITSNGSTTVCGNSYTTVVTGSQQ